MAENEKKRIKEAVALEYSPESGAPRVVASGTGQIAENIISRAEENGIPIHEDPELAHTLNMLKIGDEIPPELYTVVAQVLLFVCDIDKKMGDKLKNL